VRHTVGHGGRTVTNQHLTCRGVELMNEACISVRLVDMVRTIEISPDVPELYALAMLTDAAAELAAKIVMDDAARDVSDVA